MLIPFYKYQGTGNDFVMIDQRAKQYISRTDADIVNRLCDRRFGIGADGLIILQLPPHDSPMKYDFEMVYFNADGRESSMCGNGGRCIVAFAHFLKHIQNHCTFLAIDGPHEATITNKNWVELKMKDVAQIESTPDYDLMDTGSPHYVVFVEDLHDVNVFENGREIRYSKRFKDQGVNVNFVEQKKDGSILVGTYERGVEAETLSCGTGVTAAAIASYLKNPKHAEIPITTKGGNLKVHFNPTTQGFCDIWLCGPATQVFSGKVAL